MDDIETAKNLTVKARTAYSVWDVCRLFIEMIAPDVDIDIESKRKSDELLFSRICHKAHGISHNR